MRVQVVRPKELDVVDSLASTCWDRRSGMAQTGARPSQVMRGERFGCSMKIIGKRPNVQLKSRNLTFGLISRHNSCR
jgi:hypothetical protein